MPELTPDHVILLRRLSMRGFQPIAFPLYPGAVGIRCGAFAALLEPVAGGTFRQLGRAFYLMEGNLSVRVSQDGREWFVWKSKKVEVTPDLLSELARFSSEVLSALVPTA